MRAIERPRGSITVTALRIIEGEVTARAAGPRSRHRVVIHVAPLAAGDWEAIVSVLAADPSLFAAVLDGELPPALAEAAGYQTLEPSPGEMEWRCGCQGWYGRCRHVNAVWREVREEVRRRPALALTLRGADATRLRWEAAQLAALTAREHDAGVDAASAFERSAQVPPPGQSPPPLHPGRPESWLSPDPLIHQGLHEVAAEAASRALAILRGTGDGCLALDRQSDLSRIAAGLASPRDVDQLAWRVRMRPAALWKLVRDWRAGGPEPTAPVAGRLPAAPATQPLPALQQLSLF